MVWPAIEQPPTQTPWYNHEDIASLVTEEPQAAQNPEPRSMSQIGETLLLMHEGIPAGYQASEPPPDHKRGDTPLQQVNEELPVVGQAPQESRVMPALEATLPQRVEEDLVINHPPVQTILQANEGITLLVNGESPSVQKPPELRTIPVPEIIPPHFVEEAPPIVNEQPQARPVPSLEDITQTVNEVPPAITQGPTEAHTAHHIGDTPPNDEFGFCIACGQKVTSDFSYCPRCGKSTNVPEFPNALAESLQPRSVRPHEDAVRPEHEEPPFMKKPPEPRTMPSREEIPSSTNEEPAPIPIRYVQPKYRPVSSRDPISEVMNDRAPVMQSFPRAKAPPRALLKPVWSKIRDWSAKALAPPRDFFSGQNRLRMLYGKWAKEKDIAPEGIPSTEALKQIMKEGKEPAYQHMRLVCLSLGAIVFVVFFIFIGVTMIRCSI